MKTLMHKKPLTYLVICLVLAGTIIVTAGYSHFGTRKNLAPPPDQYILDEQSNIVGNWTSEADGSSQLVFDGAGTCYSYYGGSLLTTFSYNISNTTPQCGTNVLVDRSEQTSYLQLIDNNTGEPVCYEINGVTTVLSLTTVGSGILSTYRK